MTCFSPVLPSITAHKFPQPAAVDMRWLDTELKPPDFRTTANFGMQDRDVKY